MILNFHAPARHFGCSERQKRPCSDDGFQNLHQEAFRKIPPEDRVGLFFPYGSRPRLAAFGPEFEFIAFSKEKASLPVHPPVKGIENLYGLAQGIRPLYREGPGDLLNEGRLAGGICNGVFLYGFQNRCLFPARLVGRFTPERKTSFIPEEDSF